MLQVKIYENGIEPQIYFYLAEISRMKSRLIRINLLGFTRLMVAPYLNYIIHGLLNKVWRPIIAHY